MTTKYTAKDMAYLNAEWKYSFLLSVMTQRAENDPAGFMKLFGIEEDHTQVRELEVKVTINGVEVDYEHFIAAMESQMDRIINDRAAVLLQEGVRDKMTAIYEELAKVERNLNGLCKEVLPAWESSTQDC
jgi:hypothetical protein